jgi:hypothetical protein
MRVIESLSEDETESQETTPEIPVPVTVMDAPKGVERYDDDDVELM